jgi:hypothetical protein
MRKRHSNHVLNHTEYRYSNIMRTMVDLLRINGKTMYDKNRNYLPSPALGPIIKMVEPRKESETCKTWPVHR